MSKISFVVPTLNAQLQLESCLKSIRCQNYPQNQIEIIISDGGSTDNTIEIANKYKCTIVKNRLKTAESGKAIGLKHAKGKYIAFIDSDNILPTSKWLETMLSPFKNNQVVLTEPWSFTYRKKAGFIERYSSLIGANDPYAFICGITDRKNYVTNKWTSLNVEQKEYEKYFIVKLKKNTVIPTIGANGTIFRRAFLKKINIDSYLFDIDLISQYLKTHQILVISKVKIGIIHTYCESSIKKFIRKQTRRATDFYLYYNHRSYNWSRSNSSNIPKYIIYTILFFPALFDSVKGYLNKTDIAWFFHPLACLISLFVYGLATIKYKLGLLKPLNRSTWKQ